MPEIPLSAENINFEFAIAHENLLAGYYYGNFPKLK
jgi:hypothetical protein